uniref:Uncharacterized protein n=1 Tax=Cucumis melo TaxID=3656 RepID=A0A9I9E704_CUCME
MPYIEAFLNHKRKLHNGHYTFSSSAFFCNKSLGFHHPFRNVHSVSVLSQSFIPVFPDYTSLNKFGKKWLEEAKDALDQG